MIPTPLHRVRLAAGLSLICQLVWAVGVCAEPASGCYLYLSTPDGAQEQGRSGAGILVFDVDDGHRMVKRIEIPIFEEGLRGFTGNAQTGCVYYSTTNRRLGCFDLTLEKVLWESTFDRGCDRSSVTLDGTKIYAPTGWWYQGEESGFLVVDGLTGRLIREIPVGPQAHNSIVTLDGRHVLLGTRTMSLTPGPNDTWPC